MTKRVHHAEGSEGPRAFVVAQQDNVAVMLSEGAAGQSVKLLGESAGVVQLIEAISRSHKVALVAIEAGGVVRKYGVAIGQAKASISRGEWVHLHNCVSFHDERSAELDVRTGAPKDIDYD